MVNTSRYNLIIVFFVALSSTTYGYGFSIFSTSVGQPGFYKYFNLATTGPDAAYTNHILGAVNALFSAGAGFGALSMGWLADIIGRKRSLILATMISLIGGALVAGSVNVPMLVTLRFIQGIGLGMNVFLTPLYCTEVAPPHRRGMLTGMTSVGQVFGYFVSSWVGYGCYFAKNETFAWRFPLAGSCFFPLILMLGIYWIPESPRWLLLKGRTDESWLIVQRLHSDPNDATQLAAAEEFYQMRKQIEYDSQFDTSIAHMFKTPSLRRRIFLGCGVFFANQCSGDLTINNYSVIFYKALGLEGSLPLLMYSIYVITGSLAAIAMILLVDKVGRKPLLLTAIGGTIICMAIECGLTATYLGTNNKAGNAIAVLFLFIYEAFAGVLLIVSIYCAEIFPTTYRAKGLAMGLFVFYIGSIAFLTPAATAFANIGWKFFLIFLCASTVSFVLIYFFLPETKGKSLEELNHIFGEVVVVHLTDATEAQKAELDREIEQDLKHDTVHTETVAQPA